MNFIDFLHFFGFFLIGCEYKNNKIKYEQNFTDEIEENCVLFKFHSISCLSWSTDILFSNIKDVVLVCKFVSTCLCIFDCSFLNKVLKFNLIMTNSPVSDEINGVVVEALSIETEYGKNFKILPTNDQVKGKMKILLLDNVLVFVGFFMRFLLNYRVADYCER